MSDYQIAPHSGVCAISHKQMEEGEEFYAVLFETADGLERREYSLAAWTEPPEGYFCFWRARVPHKEQKKRLFVDDEVIINLFLRLEDSTEEIKLHFRFVLALILMRKRILKYEETVVDDGAEFWAMRLVKEKTSYRVLNPRLTDEQTTRVSQELGAILHGDLSAFDDMDAESSSDSGTLDSGAVAEAPGTEGPA